MQKQNLKLKFFFLAIIFCGVFGLAEKSFGATINAESCSLSDVSSAVVSANSGDTVMIPAGNCTWATISGQPALEINKSIYLIGAGSSSTIITKGVNQPSWSLHVGCIDVNLSSDVPVRISGIGFSFPTNNSGYQTAISLGGSVKLTNIRIDHNSFTKGDGAFVVSGQVYGVADHNTFTNVNVNYFVGDDDVEWDRASIQAGANNAEAFFFEDNAIIVNNGSEEKDPDAVIYIQEGAVVVVRHNTFDANSFTTGNFHILNNHGNQNYYSGTGDYRGSPIFEFYDNSITYYQTYGGFLGIRGGSVLIHDNEITQINGSISPINFTEEEDWQTAFFGSGVGTGNGHVGLRTTWPAQDQIFNSFVWNNTYNGNAVTGNLAQSLSSDCVGLGNPDACCTGNGEGTCDDVFIQENRDYFMHAPQASGGSELFSGERKGGSSTAPTQGDTGSMIFSSSGANAYYAYTP